MSFEITVARAERQAFALASAVHMVEKCIADADPYAKDCNDLVAALGDLIDAAGALKTTMQQADQELK